MLDQETLLLIYLVLGFGTGAWYLRTQSQETLLEFEEYFLAIVIAIFWWIPWIIYIIGKAMHLVGWLIGSIIDSIKDWRDSRVHLHANKEPPKNEYDDYKK